MSDCYFAPDCEINKKLIFYYAPLFQLSETNKTRQFSSVRCLHLLRLLQTSIMRRVKEHQTYIPNSGCLFSGIVKILYLTGLWPDDAASFTKKILYKTYQMAFYVLTVIYIIIASIGILSVKGDTITFLEQFNKNLIIFQGCIKLMFYIMKGYHLKTLIEDIRKSGDLITLKTERSMLHVTILVYALPSVVMVVFSIAALYHRQTFVILWLPFDETRNFQSLLLTTQMIGVVVAQIIYKLTAFMALFCCLIMYFCEQLKDVQIRYMNLNYSEANDKEVRVEFKKIQEKHSRIIGYVEKMNAGYEYMLLTQNCASIIELCVSAFVCARVLSSNTGTYGSFLLIGFVILLVSELINAFIYCYSGNRLLVTSEELATTVYSASWTTWPLDLQRSHLIVLIMSHKELRISAIFTDITLECFTMLVSRGYSMFAMLCDVATT